ncbi:hypothetical protein KDRO_B02350 [Kluyveromyces lactis]|nr:hypothetical protein KDRO_B02350 [Kluyveromyces lactis]
MIGYAGKKRLEIIVITNDHARSPLPSSIICNNLSGVSTDRHQEYFLFPFFQHDGIVIIVDVNLTHTWNGSSGKKKFVRRYGEGISGALPEHTPGLVCSKGGSCEEYASIRVTDTRHPHKNDYKPTRPGGGGMRLLFRCIYREWGRHFSKRSS